MKNHQNIQIQSQFSELFHRSYLCFATLYVCLESNELSSKQHLNNPEKKIDKEEDVLS